MKVLIVEDEAMARKKLASTLKELYPDTEIEGETGSVSETIAWLKEPGHEPDIIFMDVELSDGDCFGIFRQADIRANVIMTTAYDHYAVKAFEVESIDYLLKPIEPGSLKRAVERCMARMKAMRQTGAQGNAAEKRLNPFKKQIRRNVPRQKSVSTGLKSFGGAALLQIRNQNDNLHCRYFSDFRDKLSGVPSRQTILNQN